MGNYGCSFIGDYNNYLYVQNPQQMKEKTAMMELIEWIDNEIILNPYYRASPRFTEGAAVVKAKSESLLAKERQQIVEAYDDGKDEGSTATGNFEWGIRYKEMTAEQYFNSKYTK